MELEIGVPGVESRERRVYWLGSTDNIIDTLDEKLPVIQKSRVEVRTKHYPRFPSCLLSSLSVECMGQYSSNLYFECSHSDYCCGLFVSVCWILRGSTPKR